MLKFFKSKFFITFVVIITGMLFAYSFGQDVLKGYVQKVPENFYGIWRVTSTLEQTDSPAKFKKNSIDLWNIFSYGNVIKLSNPFSGAEADISIENSDKDFIVFVKTGNYENKILTDRVEIQINQDYFDGVDYIELQTKSDVDGSIVKTETAKYQIKGERLAGQKIKGD